MTFLLFNNVIKAIQIQKVFLARSEFNNKQLYFRRADRKTYQLLIFDQKISDMLVIIIVTPTILLVQYESSYLMFF